MGTWGNVLISQLLLVIPMSYPCHYTNVCPHLSQRCTHTHTHIHIKYTFTSLELFYDCVINSQFSLKSKRKKTFQTSLSLMTSMNQSHCLLYVLSSEYLTTIHVIHHSPALRPRPGTQHQALICWLTGTQIRMAVVKETTHTSAGPMPWSMLLGNPDDYSEPANVGSNATRADQRGKHYDPVSL